MLDPDLVNDFMRGFKGYGNWRAKLWFVGLEEGGRHKLVDIERRMTKWDARGRHELEDLQDYHYAIGVRRHHGQNAKIQNTWGKLSHIALAADGRIPRRSGSEIQWKKLEREIAREFQRSELGRWNKSTTLIELLPLPSPSTSEWLYSATGIESLMTREIYRTRVRAQREHAIRSAIEEHHPQVVVFYGLDDWYRESWERIANTRFTEVQGQRFSTGVGNSKFILAPHTGAHGITNDDWHAIGRFIRETRKN